MKKNHKSNFEDEINLLDIVKILFKEKIIILSFCFIGLVSSFFLSKTIFAPKSKSISIAVIEVEKISETPFNLLGFLIPTGQAEKIYDLYNNKFIDTVKSKKNFHDYFDVYGKELINIIDLSKNFLEYDKFLFEDYFNNKINNVSNTKTIAVYRFDFHSNEIDGKKFLDHYFEFTKRKVNSYIIDILKSNIDEYLIFLLNEYEISKNLEYNYPANEKDNMIFTIGKERLSSRINLIKSINERLGKNDLKFSNYFLIHKASSVIKNPSENNLQKHIYIGITIGFLLSLIIIFFKTEFKKL